MALAYISPTVMEGYKKKILLFTKSAPALEVVHSHYFHERNGVCDLTASKEAEEIFVLANRAGQTMKVSRSALQIVANVVEINGIEAGIEHLRLERKAHRERVKEEQSKREQQATARQVVVRRKSPSTTLKDNETK
jgi:hypothetical protein